MKNFEKFKTAEERAMAFNEYCDKNSCQKCFDDCMSHAVPCLLKWLDLEAEEEKPLPCPFCGGECTVDRACTNEHHDDGTWFVSCNNENCYYSSGLTHGKDAAIAKHNSVAKILP